jgi:hypothetical protein
MSLLAELRCNLYAQSGFASISRYRDEVGKLAFSTVAMRSYMWMVSALTVLAMRKVKTGAALQLTKIGNISPREQVHSFLKTVPSAVANQSLAAAQAGVHHFLPRWTRR